MADRFDLINFSKSVATTLGGTAANVNIDSNTLVVDGVNNRVGIGTASPAAGLNVAGNRLLLGPSSEVYAMQVGFSQARVSAGQAYYIGASDSATPDLVLSNSAGLERMRVDSSGNVGIGTSSASARLHVVGSSGSTQARLGTAAGYYEVNAFDGNPVYMVVNGTNHTSGVIGTQSNTPFVFFTNNAERARITSGGSFCLGTSSVLGKMTMLWNNAVEQGFGLQALGGTFNGSPVVFYNSSGGVSGFIGQTASSVSYNTSSDYRLKENVVPLTDASARVQALKPSRFNFIADPDRTVDGFIAHEAVEVVPEAVSGEKDAVNEDGSIKPQGIDHSKLVPLLTAALQEALTEIASLKARLIALEAK